LDSPKLIGRTDQTVEQVVDNGIVALQLESGKCYGFNNSAARIWSLIEQPKSKQQLCDILQDEFSVDAATCRADVEKTLNQLRDEGLIEFIGS